MSDTHTLVITADPDPQISPDYEIECPGVTDSCRMWIECGTPNCRRGNPDANEAVVHGKQHKLLFHLRPCPVADRVGAYLAEQRTEPADSCTWTRGGAVI